MSRTINYKKRLYIEIFNKINVKINTFDIDDCHCMGESKKTTIVRFIIRKNCKAVLEISWVNRYLDNDKLVFQSDARIYFSENLTPYNHHLAWKCRELKRAGKIHSCWSAKGVVKIRKTMNKHNTDMTLTLLLYTLILFFEREQDQDELIFKERINSGSVDQDVFLPFTLTLIMIRKNHSNIPDKSNMSLT